MTDSQWDEIIKKQLLPHDSPVPEDMWERIIRKKDKDRKGFFFFFSLIGLFLLGFGLAGVLLFNTNKKGHLGQKQNIFHSNAIPHSDTVQSAGTGQDLKMNPSVNQEAAFGGAGTVLNTARHTDYLKNSIPAQRSRGRSPLNRQNNYSKTEQSRSIRDTITNVVNSEGSPDTNKITNEKVNPVLTPTSKPITVDSVKTATLKKSDSTKKNVESKWSLDLYASPDYPIDHNQQEYIKGQLSYTVGLRLNRSFGKRFSAKIGIQFSQLNYVLPDSSSSPGANHLKRLDLPVLAGYSLGNETIGMTVNAGVIFNLYSWLGPGQFNYIKTNTGLSLYLGFNFSKHINERIDIFSEPYYRYQLSSMVISPNYFPKYIDVVGLSFGVRYHFKK